MKLQKKHAHLITELIHKHMQENNITPEHEEYNEMIILRGLILHYADYENERRIS